MFTLIAVLLVTFTTWLVGTHIEAQDDEIARLKSELADQHTTDW